MKQPRVDCCIPMQEDAIQYTSHAAASTRRFHCIDSDAIYDRQSLATLYIVNHVSRLLSPPNTLHTHTPIYKLLYSLEE
jgi:hypothetical protein